MTELNIPNISLNDGTAIPQLGFGVFLVDADEAVRVAADALDTGYRHLDTAMVYRNEAETAQAMRESGIAREDIYLTTKLWNGDQSRPLDAFQESLDRLQLDYVDLYLIHWPLPTVGTALGAWEGLIKIAESGRAKSIGVSNFETEHLQQLIDETGVTPAVNQIELHPYHQRGELREYCREHGIAVEAWGPIGQGKTDLFEQAPIVQAAQAHGVTPAQVILRWHTQHDIIVIPKTVSKERMLENASIFGFELNADEMAAIDALERGANNGPDPRTYDNR